MTPSKRTTAPGRTTASKSPSEIAEGVFVGGWKDALTFDGDRFCVLDEAPDDMPPGRHIPIYDEERDRANRENLDRLAASVRRSRSQGRRVLIFCGHGVRRSPLGGAWYLHTVEGLSLDAAYERVQAVRPKAEHADRWVGNASELEGV